MEDNIVNEFLTLNEKIEMIKNKNFKIDNRDLIIEDDGIYKIYCATLDEYITMENNAFLSYKKDENDLISASADAFIDYIINYIDSNNNIIKLRNIIPLEEIGVGNLALYCDNCGCLTLIDEIIQTDDGDLYCDYCDDCYYYCDGCDTYHSSRIDYITTREGHTFCENSRDNIIYCEECDNYIEEYIYDEETDEYLCRNCYNERHETNNNINSYYYKPEAIFFKAKNENTDLYYGFELEVENYGVNTNRETAKDISNITDKLLYFKSDGSLSTGFEIVSHPMTFNYIKENGEKFKNVLELLANNGYKSHDTSSCGLHIHISKKALGDDTEEINRNVNKIILFFEYYKELVEKVARRKNNSYAQFYQDYFSYMENIKAISKTIDFIDKNKNRDRYFVINNLNSNTLEIRIFKGTLKFETFMATFEFVNNLINCIINNAINKISFSKVVNYQKTIYLKDYLKAINLEYNYEYLKSYDYIIEKMRNKNNKIIENLKKEIFYLIELGKNLQTDLILSKPMMDFMLEDIGCPSLSIVNDISYNLTNFIMALRKNNFVNKKPDLKYNLNAIKSAIQKCKIYNDDFTKYDDDLIKIDKIIEEVEKICA